MPWVRCAAVGVFDAPVPCYYPVPAYRTAAGVSFAQLARDDHFGSIDLPCGQCIGCRIRRAQDWTLRITHEQKFYKASSFLTLTYDDAALPPHGSLRYSDFQRFIRRVRKSLGPVRFYMCGEYGSLTFRPHYHACLFGQSFASDRVRAGSSDSGEATFASAVLSRLWPHGLCTVQDLTPASAAYCARYVTEKLTGDAGKALYRFVDSDGESHAITPPFNRMSLRPGIGARWLARYASDVTTSDVVITGRGSRARPPRYYDKLRKRADQAELEAAQFSRYVKGKEHAADNTLERLRTRAAVESARLSFYKRSL